MGRKGQCKLCALAPDIRRRVEYAMDAKHGGTMQAAKDLAYSMGITLAESVVNRHRADHPKLTPTIDATDSIPANTSPTSEVLPAIVPANTVFAATNTRDVVTSHTDVNRYAGDDAKLREGVEQVIQKGITDILAGTVVLTARDTLGFITYHTQRYGVPQAPTLHGWEVILRQGDTTVGVKMTEQRNVTE